MMASSLRLLLKLEFDGAPFCGWQRQSPTHEAKHLPSIQGVVEKALKKLFSISINVQGCGRTDAGVHAEVFAAHFDLPAENLKNFASLSNLRGALNRLLPESVRVKKIFQVESGFHALRSLAAKTYQYRVFLGEVPPVLLQGRVYPYKSAEFSESRLLKSLKLFEGKKDFAAFASSGYSVSTTVRTIYSASCSFEEYPRNSPQGKILTLTFKGNGFLKQMVRNLSGTALQIAGGKKDFAFLEYLFCQPQIARQEAHGFLCAPACALYMVHLNYPSLEGFHAP